MRKDGEFPRLIPMTAEIKQAIERELIGTIMDIRIRVDDDDCMGNSKTRFVIGLDKHTQKRLMRVREFLVNAAEHGTHAEAVASTEPSAPTIAVPVVKL